MWLYDLYVCNNYSLSSLWSLTSIACARQNHWHKSYNTYYIISCSAVPYSHLCSWKNNWNRVPQIKISQHTKNIQKPCVPKAKRGFRWHYNICVHGIHIFPGITSARLIGSDELSKTKSNFVTIYPDIRSLFDISCSVHHVHDYL